MQRKVLWWVVSVYSTAAEERSEEGVVRTRIG